LTSIYLTYAERIHKKAAASRQQRTYLPFNPTNPYDTPEVQARQSSALALSDNESSIFNDSNHQISRASSPAYAESMRSQRSIRLSALSQENQLATNRVRALERRLRDVREAQRLRLEEQRLLQELRELES
jgi:hypothetical protein